jgi:hypothetical protein
MNPELKSEQAEKLAEAKRHKAEAAQKNAEVASIRQDQLLDGLTRNAADLQAKIFDPMRWIVPDILPEGLSMLAGKPKIGKSWAALDISIAVASGGSCLGKVVEEGDVLLLALEDTDRRLQRRITTLLGVYRQDWPKRLTYATAWLGLEGGGIDLIRRWVGTVPKARLIIVDVLERVRQRGKNSQTSQYSADYEALVSLHRVAAEFQLSVLVLHHQRKMGADDLMDTVSGTLGRDDGGHFLYGRGRDLEEFTIAVKLDDHCRWQNLGTKAEGQASEAREQVVEAMRKHNRPMRLDEIAKAVDRPKESIKMLISRLHRAGEIRRVADGVYRLASAQAEMDIDVGKI